VNRGALLDQQVGDPEALRGLRTQVGAVPLIDGKVFLNCLARPSG
jgi:hypothetical protein